MIVYQKTGETFTEISLCKYSKALHQRSEMMNPTSLDHVRITHIGGPTALIEIGQLRLLTDPAFEPAGYQYMAGPQLVIKTTSPALAVPTLEPIDAVLLSHDQHNDNLDPAGRAYLSQAKQVLTTPAGAQRLAGTTRGIPDWETINLTGKDGLDVRVTATPARHGPAEVQQATGPVNGWILEWEGQQHGTLYVSGDTVLFEGLEEIARRYHIGIALLHLGAAHAERFGPDPLTLTAEEGARFAKMLGEAIIIPIHYEGWTHLTEGHDEIQQAFAEAGLEKQLRFLPLGQPVSFEI
jgi:L-ascorbate metabolism protein UlaG (beta-lactamase superfamily)